jgi:hypothetical protein
MAAREPLTFSDSKSACLAVQALSGTLVGIDCADLALLAGHRSCSSKPSASIQHAVACTLLHAAPLWNVDCHTPQN